VNLLQDLQDELGITYLFIAHDLSVVRHISNRVAIMYAGQIVEIADRDTIYERPLHPYTEALLSSIPVPNPQLQRDRRRIVLSGEIPDTLEPPSGCRFASRCPLVEERCHVEMPSLSPRSETHDAACWVR
jgi:peptide/nickel transport system ATP-binding protein